MQCFIALRGLSFDARDTWRHSALQGCDVGPNLSEGHLSKRRQTRRPSLGLQSCFGGTQIAILQSKSSTTSNLPKRRRGSRTRKNHSMMVHEIGLTSLTDFEPPKQQMPSDKEEKNAVLNYAASSRYTGRRRGSRRAFIKGVNP